MAATRDGRTLRRAVLIPNRILLPAAAAAAVLVYLAARDGGYSPTHWYPAAIFLLALLVLALVVVPAGGRPPALVAAAIALLVAYTVWSYLSIAWAHERADAWDGANRTALYAIVFALFALWPLRRRAAALLAGGLSLALAALAAVALVRVSGSPSPEDLFVFSRLAWPIDYPNATVCLWFLAFWPCVALAARREVHPALRATFMAAAVVLGGAALLGQSRGWLFALPVAVLFFLLVSPGRARLLWTLAAVGLAMWLVSGPTLDAHDALGADRSAGEPLDRAVRAIFGVAAAAGLVALVIGAVEARVRVRPRVARRAGAATTAAAAVAGALAITVLVIQVGNPVNWLDDRWDEFKGGSQPTEESARFTQGLGSNRYDFWRVGWQVFEREPLTGIGADNFRHDYLRLRRSSEEPYYPHSVVVRTLSQTGVVGALLLGGAVGCVLIAAWQAVRRRTRTGAAVAAAAVTSFAYFLIHGSVDWFWELPALGALAWALAGIAVAMSPRQALIPRTRRAREPLLRGPLALGAAALGAGLLVASFAAPWLAELENRRAARIYNADPRQAPRALDALDRAARLNPFSTRPRLLAAQIGVSLERPRLAEQSYLEVIERDPRDQYSHLALAALAADDGRRREALRYAERARALSPRDPLATEVVERLRRGDDFTIGDLNRRFDRRADARSG